MKINQILLLILFSTLISQLWSQVEEKDYNLELVKFYNSIEEYNLTIDHLDSLETVDYLSDSLMFFKAIAYNKIDKSASADSIFINLIQSSYDEPLARSCFAYLKENILGYESIDQIEITSGLLNDLQYEFLRLDLLMFLAEIYEGNQLFSEANDVYEIVIAESYHSNADSINIKIASNLIFTEQYSDAINLLKPISTASDSTLIADSFYLLYIAYSALDEYNSAYESLLHLYLDYPDLENRVEIIEKLADTSYRLEKYLLSWYFLDKLSKLDSNILELDRKIENIKAKISTENLENPFDKLIFIREIKTEKNSN